MTYAERILEILYQQTCCAEMCIEHSCKTCQKAIDRGIKVNEVFGDMLDNALKSLEEKK